MRTKKGIVTSAKMTGTVAVAVTRDVIHPKYRKRYPVTKKFLADTGGLEVKEGDKVLIAETRPLSRRKRFRVLEVTGSVATGFASLEEELREAGEREKGTLRCDSGQAGKREKDTRVGAPHGGAPESGLPSAD